MKKLTPGLVLLVLGSNCWLAWAMLTLLVEVRAAGRVLPYFTVLCISLRPLLVALPCVAAAVYGGFWLRREERSSPWTWFTVTAIAALLLFVLPAISTSYLLMADQVKAATGIHSTP